MAKRSDKREFLMLAHNFDIEKAKEEDYIGWYMSEKLDGHRAFWDGGVSRGISVSRIPFANTERDKKDYIATGLWSRGGKVIHAPDSFLDRLPIDIMLDGELYLGRGSLQKLSSIVRDEDPERNGKDWSSIKYHIFDSPSVSKFSTSGRIHAGKWEARFVDLEISSYLNLSKNKIRDLSLPFSQIVELFNELPFISPVRPVKQTVIKSIRDVLKALDVVSAGGGEGLMLRAPDSVWEPSRSHNLLKVKKFYDAEAEILGFKYGEKTDRGSRLLGKIGALVVKELGTGHVFEICGLNDEERELDPESHKHGIDNPGKVVLCPSRMGKFKEGQIITFKYWDRTKDGIPKFANYWRDKEEI